MECDILRYYDKSTKFMFENDITSMIYRKKMSKNIENK